MQTLIILSWIIIAHIIYFIYAVKRINNYTIITDLNLELSIKEYLICLFWPITFWKIKKYIK